MTLRLPGAESNVLTATTRVAVVITAMSALAARTAAHDPALGQATAGATAVETVLDAWQARQAKMRSAVVEWTGRVTEQKGADAATDFETVVPPEDVAFDLVAELRLDGDRMFYQLADQEWGIRQGKLMPRRYLSAYDGDVVSTFFPVSSGRQPQGGIAPEGAEPVDASTNDLGPLVMTLRPVDPRVRFYWLSHLRLKGVEDDVDGRRCVVIEQPSEGGTPAVTLWLDPQRDYSLLRIIQSVDGAQRLRFDIRYRQDGATKLWLPHAWRMTETMRGPTGPGLFIDATVGSYQINPALSIDQFQIHFPPNACVIDEREGRRYIVRPGGVKRYITDAELVGSTYEKLLRTETGHGVYEERDAPPSTRALRIVAIGVTAAVTLALAIAVLAKWRSGPR